MSSTGNPPQDPQNPYDQPNPYGQPAYGQPAYGQPAYGQPGYGTPAFGAAPDYAPWIKRVGAYLIDLLVMLVAYIPAMIGSIISGSDSSGASAIGLLLTVVGFALYIAVFVWNICIKQGRTGYSIGKGVMGIKLIGEASGQPIGAGLAFVRNLAHILDALVCYIGFLWPLWDSKRQTFADKIMSTIVVNQPQG